MDLDPKAVKKELSRIKYWVKRYTRPPIDFESLTQELWIKGWQLKVDHVPVTVIRNHCYDALRRLRVEREYQEGQKGKQVYEPNGLLSGQRADNDSRSGSILSERSDLIQRLTSIARLSPEEASVIYHRFYRDCTIFETARAVGKTQHQVEVLINNAISRLRVAQRSLL